MNRLPEGKIAVITGSGRGIGQRESRRETGDVHATTCP